MTYLGGEGTGYESVNKPLYIGLAWTDRPLGSAHEWQAQDKPVMSIHDKDAQWWEKLTQYKSVVYWDKEKTLGAPFVMFYNAAGRHPETDLKAERVGIALSKDMKKWKRYPGNPVFAHEADGTITGMRISRKWATCMSCSTSRLLNRAANTRHSIHLLPVMTWCTGPIGKERI